MGKIKKYWSCIYCFLILVLYGCDALSTQMNSSSPSVYLQQEAVSLSAPIIKAESIFFDNQLEVSINMNIPGVKIYYTVNGENPSENSTLYKSPIILEKSNLIKTIAFHPGYITSEVAQKEFKKLGASKSIAKVEMTRVPHRNYPGIGELGLINRLKGTTNFKTDQWMGFDGGDLEVVIEFVEEIELSEVTGSFLSDPASWIFLPKCISVFHGSNKNKLVKLGTVSIDRTKESDTRVFRYGSLNFDENRGKYLKVIIENHDEIPYWHPGKGTNPWLFIDEILFE